MCTHRGVAHERHGEAQLALHPAAVAAAGLVPEPAQPDAAQHAGHGAVEGGGRVPTAPLPHALFTRQTQPRPNKAQTDAHTRNYSIERTHDFQPWHNAGEELPGCWVLPKTLRRPKKRKVSAPVMSSSKGSSWGQYPILRSVLGSPTSQPSTSALPCDRVTSPVKIDKVVVLPAPGHQRQKSQNKESAQSSRERARESARESAP